MHDRVLHSYREELRFGKSWVTGEQVDLHLDQDISWWVGYEIFIKFYLEEQQIK